MSKLRQGLATLACATLIAALPACGGDDSNDSETAPVGGDNSGSLGPPTILRLSYGDGQGSREAARLTCSDDQSDGTGYLAERAGPACRELRATGPSLFDPPAADQACTQIYGGPEILRVSGRVDYETVKRSFSRKNGCEIADWNKLGPLLPDGAPGETG